MLYRFRRLGFSGPVSGAKHAFMIKNELKACLPNPHGADIGVHLLKEILRQAGINVQDWHKADS